jgi:hypothetical protein
MPKARGDDVDEALLDLEEQRWETDTGEWADFSADWYTDEKGVVHVEKREYESMEFPMIPFKAKLQREFDCDSDPYVIQGMDFDIVAQGRTIQEVEERFITTVAAEYQYDLSKKLDPLMRIPPAPEDCDYGDEVDPAIWPKLIELLKKLPKDETPDPDDIDPIV